MKRYLALGIGVLGLCLLLGISDIGTGEASAADTAASIVIDGGVIKNTIRTNTGETAYNSYKIAVKADDIESYSLQISAADGSTSNLLPENGNTQITGANGAIGSSLTNNTWGYGWSNTETAVDQINYYTLPAYGSNGTSISNGLLESDKVESVDIVKKLTFAAKFGDNATPGHYTTTVLLSLAVSPKAVVGDLSSISTMQEMYTEESSGVSEVCKNSAVGDKTTLTDTRGNMSYAVAKLADGNCWMTQNLRLTGARVLNTADSDVTANFSLPASVSVSAFANTTSEAKIYDSGNNAYGAYYNWYAATAGSGTGTISSGNVAQSICPKGWKLPSQSDYSKLATSIGAGDNASGSAIFRNSTYNFQMGARIDNSSLSSSDIGSYGFYWSRTASTNNYAYNLYLGVNTAKPADAYYKRTGCSVRCVSYAQ